MSCNSLYSMHVGPTPVAGDEHVQVPSGKANPTHTHTHVRTSAEHFSGAWGNMGQHWKVLGGCDIGNLCGWKKEIVHRESHHLEPLCSALLCCHLLARFSKLVYAYKTDATQTTLI